MDKFNQSKYVNQYNKDNYTSCSIKIKPKNMQIITEYSQNLGISKTALIQKCVLYCYENMIDISKQPIE